MKVRMYKYIGKTVLNVRFELVVGAEGCDASAQHMAVWRLRNNKRPESQLRSLQSVGPQFGCWGSGTKMPAVFPHIVLLPSKLQEEPLTNK